MKKLRLVALLLCLVMAAGVTACGGDAPTASGGDAAPATSGGGAAPAGEERSRTLNIGMEGKLVAMDPHDVLDTDSRLNLQMTYETLVETDHAGNYSPLLATEWSVSDDGLVWTFKLREGVTFQNGEAFNADDVVYNIQRLVDNKDVLRAAIEFPELAGATKVDDYTVEINLSSVRPDAMVAFATLLIIPNEAHAAEGDDMFFDQNHSGTGAWNFEEWVDGQHCRFTKNENYWNLAVHDSYFNEVYIRFTTEVSSAIAAHLAGDIEAYISGDLPVDMRSMYEGTENQIEITTRPVTRFTGLTMNFREGSIFLDENVRKAFTTAIDRQTIIDGMLPDAKIPHGIFNEAVEGYDGSIEAPVYDPELAKQLLADSSYNGESFSLLVRTGDWQEDAAILIQEMVNAVGFNMELELVDFSVLTPRLSSGEFDMFLLTTGHQMGSPRLLFNEIKVNSRHNEFQNVEGSAEIFALCDEWFGEVDDAARTATAQELNRLLSAGNHYRTVLLEYQQTQAINYGITGLMLFPDGQYQFQYVDYDPSLIPA